MLSTDQIVASKVQLKPIQSLLEERWSIPQDALIPYGHYKSKLLLEFNADLNREKSKTGKLVLVTGMSPTPAGEGKTTTTIGLTDALNQIGVDATACLREPSLGPCFGMKGGAHGGGKAQVAPLTDINLHFTGDIHAIGMAHNLLSSLIDNELYWENHLDIDPQNVAWRRAVDLNDRALRRTALTLRGGATRPSGFDITATSEVMAILCLATDSTDFQNRLADIVIGRTKSGELIKAESLGATGAMAVVMKDALNPNLVQTLEHNPVFIHGGPFANIAHGCSSVLASNSALNLADVVVTEAGFGADLGAEKFLDIKCRQSGLRPDAVVLTCTARALKFHGGIDVSELEKPNVSAVRRGSANLLQHVENLVGLGLKPVVSVNRFAHDTDAELKEIQDILRERNIRSCISEYWADGGVGALELAHAVMESIEGQECKNVRFPYTDDMSLKEKIEAVAHTIYRASDVVFSDDATDGLAEIESLGFGNLPVCIAKTQYSFSADPKLLGAEQNHELPIRAVQLSNGARFVVVLTGSILTMPGLPRKPAALHFCINDNNEIEGFN